MKSEKRRVAVNIIGHYVPGLNAVIAGIARAASELDWEVMAIRNGFEGLLFRERFPDRGMFVIPLDTIERLSPVSGGLMGSSLYSDPFRVRALDKDNNVTEVDRSDEIVQIMASEGIDSVIMIVERHSIAVGWKLSRKGIPIVCVPMSVDNDVAATMLSLGFNSALTYVIETIDRLRTSAATSKKVVVIETPDKHAGWLALQAGIAVTADAILLPEIPYDIVKVAQRLNHIQKAGKCSSVIVVAAGALPSPESEQLPSEGSRVIEKSGLVAETVANQIQRLTGFETSFFVLDALVFGGQPTAVDRQLGVGYGAGAIRALESGKTGVMVAFQPPELTFEPLQNAVNKIRTVAMNSEFIHVARTLGISLGD